MFVLSIKTDNPEAEIGLFEDNSEITHEKWKADRELAETLHIKISDMLRKKNYEWSDISGVVCYEGPGSFTGLRIGLSVANALAYGLKIPIAAATGEDWAAQALVKITDTEKNSYVSPKYGSLPHITKPRK